MKHLKKLPIHLILIGIGFFFLLPFIWMLSTALKTDQQVLINPPIWIPRPVMWENFVKAINYIPFFRYMGNTSLIAVLDVLGTVRWWLMAFRGWNGEAGICCFSLQ